MKGQMQLYYDVEGDFLEVSFDEPAQEGTTEEIEQGVFMTKDIETKRITNIGILNFKKRTEILHRLLNKINKRLPINIS